MPRYTRKEINSLMEALCREFGIEFTTEFPSKAGQMYLEYNPTYGGYALCKYVDSMTDKGAHGTMRVMDKRYSPNELAEHISFALTMLRQAGKSEPDEVMKARIEQEARRLLQ